MKTNVSKMNVKDLANLNAIAESYQRCRTAGSHKDLYARQLIEDCATTSNHLCGTVYGQTLDDGQIAMIDGFSRFNDFKKFFNDDLKIKIEVQEVDEEGNTSSKMKEYTYEELPQFYKNNIESAYVLFVKVEECTLTERQRLFHELNSGKALTGIQKETTVLTDEFMTIEDSIYRFLAEHEMLTEAQEKNDIARQISAQIIANVNGCYAAGAKKLMTNVSGLKNYNLQYLDSALKLLDSSAFGTNDKYLFITLVSILCQKGKTFAEVAKKAGIEKGFANCKFTVDDIYNSYTVNCLYTPFNTAGANSAVKNAERFEKVLKAAKKIVATATDATEEHTDGESIDLTTLTSDSL